MQPTRWLAAVLAGVVIGLTANTPLSHAQAPPRHALIAILEPGPAERPAPVLPRMREALAELGWVEGRTARFETRYADWQPDRMARLARELVGLKPDVLYTHSTPAVRAAAQATTSVPIVDGVAGDLVATGVVKSLARPGGNVTGMTLAMSELDGKRLEVLKAALPSISRVANLFVPGTTPDASLQALDGAARVVGVQLLQIAVREPGQLEVRFSDIVKERVQAVFVADTASFAANVDRITALALKHRLPTISQMPRFADSGGLLQYGADVLDLARRSATLVDKILRGAKPGDLPIEQPTKVDLTVNLRTARALGISIPQGIIAQAARVIE
jgi:putative tryptophan/tyrosine transport system substrate-binding protein